MTSVRLVEFLGHGGLAIYAHLFAGGLRDQGIDARVVTARDNELAPLAAPGELVELFDIWNPRSAEPEQNGVFARRRRTASRAFRLLRAWRALIAYLDVDRPDWVQFGEILSPLELPFLRLLRRRGFRLCDVCHNVLPFDTRAASHQLRKAGTARLFLYRELYRSFDRVFVHGDWSQTTFAQLYPTMSSRVVAIPHGNESIYRLKANASSETIRRRLDLPESAPVALFFGTLVKYKGVEDLVQAFPEVLRQTEDGYLVIAGYPMIDLERLRADIASLGIGDRVRIWPSYVPLEEVGALLELARVVVFPYRSIDQSGVLQLAYTFGKPVVATTVGGLPEVVDDGLSGLLVPPGDGEALARAIVTLLNDPERAQRMGAYARRLSETRFSWEEVGRQAASALDLTTEALIASAVGTSRRPPR